MDILFYLFSVVMVCYSPFLSILYMLLLLEWTAFAKQPPRMFADRDCCVFSPLSTHHHRRTTLLNPTLYNTMHTVHVVLAVSILAMATAAAPSNNAFSRVFDRIGGALATGQTKQMGAQVVQELDATTLRGMQSAACKLSWINNADKECDKLTNGKERNTGDLLALQDCIALKHNHKEIVSAYDKEKGFFQSAKECPVVPLPGAPGYVSFSRTQTGMMPGQPMMGQPMMGQPMMGEPMAQPMMGEPMMG